MMGRCSARVVAVALAVALAAGGLAAQEGDPRASLTRALGEVERLEAAGDLAAARSALEHFAQGDAYAALLEQGPADVLNDLRTIAAAAASLDLPQVQLDVLGEVHERLAASRDLADPVLLDAKLELARARLVVGDLHGAEELYEAVHAVRAERLEPDDPDRLVAELNLGITRLELGRLDEALALFEHVHAVRSASLPEDHPDLLEAEKLLAVARKQTGDLHGALELEQHVHDVRARTLSEDDPDLLAAKQNLAVTLWSLGDAEATLELEETVHDARSRLLPPDHPQLLDAKQNLAATRRTLGDLEGARELLVAVVEARARRLPPDHPARLSAEQNLALVRAELGDVWRARAIFERVLAVRERHLPPDDPGLLASKQNLALMRIELGDSDGAIELLEQVLEARERRLPPEHPDLLRTRLNLAQARFQSGDAAGALAVAERVDDDYARILPETHPERQRAQAFLAIVLRESGRLVRALELEESLHAACVRSLPEEHPDRLRSAQNLALTRRGSGDLEGALELEEHVWEVRRRVLPRDHPDALASLENLAVTRRLSGDASGARAATRELLDRQLDRIARLRLEPPRTARAGAREELRRLSSALYTASAPPPEERASLAAALFSVLEGLRLVSTSSSELASAARRDPALRTSAARLREARRALADEILATPAEPSAVDAWRARVVERAEERDRLERELRAALGTQGVSTRPPSAAAVAAGLEQGAVLLSFFEHVRYRDPVPEDPTAAEPVRSLVAFALTPDARVRRIELGPCASLQELASSWRRAVGKPIERGLASGEESDRERRERREQEAGRRLSAALFTPGLDAVGGDVRRLHVILDRFLHLVPVDALPFRDGRRLGETLEVRTEVSVGRLLAGPQRTPETGVLVALGDVDFGPPGAEPGGVSEAALARPWRAAARTFERLIQTRFEVEALAELFGLSHAGEPVVLTRGEATKEALHELAPRARWLHVATHGWSAPEESTPEDASGDRVQRTLLGFAPETLCGLALAGANRGQSTAGEFDGVLTAEELATLDLARCDLAVLSGCETGLGIRRAGQGVQSLQSALHAAGARTAITSLWRVDDASTRRLMELFYLAYWEEGRSKADALWRAKLALRDEGHRVEDWAGWVLTGDPE